jgi:thiamine-monophosphate kinase
VTLGIGDDAAVVRWAGSEMVVTTDLLCDGVHFVLAETEPGLVGRKALAVNLSDLAAMAARPKAAVIAVLWPRDIELARAQAVYEGLMELADEFDVAVVGGDTNSWLGPLVISVTLWGEGTPLGLLRRDAAQVGDAILVTGQLGGSRLGHHLTFDPRVYEAIELKRRFTLHAGMDISDGLSLDLSRLVAASKVGAELTLASIPISHAAEMLSQASGRTALDHALADGEDFELLLTAPPDAADRILQDAELSLQVSRIGTIVAEPGLWHLDALRQRQPLAVQGYLH